jgi:hypothetical protein
VNRFALVSAGGSPGVTTAALALALGWPGQVILAECDRSGGDVAAGLFAGHLPATSGLLPLAVQAGQDAAAAVGALWQQLVPLDEDRSRWLLAGLTDPRQAAALAPAWPVLVQALENVPADVIADCGRLDDPGTAPPVLGTASLAVLVLRPTLRQVSKARPRVAMLTGMLGGPGRLAALIVGEGGYTAREIGGTLGLPVIGTLPEDAKAAAVLSDGRGTHRRLAVRPLLRAAAAAGAALREAAARGAAPAAAELGAAS